MNNFKKLTIKRRFSILAILLIIAAVVQNIILLSADSALAKHADELSAQEIPLMNKSHQNPNDEIFPL